MERRTSPFASGSVLPSSRVISAAIWSKRRSMMSAALYKMLPRAGPAVADHAGSAAAAAAAAASMSCAVPFTKQPTTSSVLAGLRSANVSAPFTHSPLM